MFFLNLVAGYGFAGIPRGEEITTEFAEQRGEEEIGHFGDSRHPRGIIGSTLAAGWVLINSCGVFV